VRAGGRKRAQALRVLGCFGALAALATAPAAAQDPQGVAEGCAGQPGADAALCALTVGAGRDLAADVGLLAGPGSDVPGQVSALGRRLGGTPRFALSLRAGGHSVTVPDLGGGAAGERSAFVPAVHAGLGLGLFDGFALLPTVGGVLALDLMGQASFLFFPGSQGFDGRVDVFSVGARVGLLRESFTLPGVTLSLSRRFSGSLRLGDTGAGDAGQALIDPAVNSVRATVGKDLFAFGVLAGVGWDDFSSRIDVRVSDGAGGLTDGGGRVEGSRRLYFLGFSKQIGVLSWISAEAGWARGFDPVSLGGASSPDRGSTLFGSLALLFKL
jgi:hypothetical protein